MLRSLRISLLALVLCLCLAGSVESACPLGDLHKDCHINFLDVRQLAFRWLDADCSAPGCAADLDGVAGVDMVDFAFLANNWGMRGEITLVINEFMADNERTIEDPDDSGDFPDWIEIYNYGDDPMDIGGIYITDHPDRPYDWKLIPDDFPEQTTIPAGGFLLIWADGDPQQGPLHVDFGLGRGGDEIALYDAFANLIDYVAFGAQGEDQSRGRLPDGSDNWVDFGVGSTTPGKSNRFEQVRVMMSEIMYHPYHEPEQGENIGEEYIELFNSGTSLVDLSGWRFSNGVDYTIPDAVTLDAGEYLVVASDVNAFTAKYSGGVNVIGGWIGRLSNSGERIELVDDVGVIVDTLRYADQGEWTQRLLGPEDYGHRGWTWSNAHDGDGKSLELINPDLPNEHGCNWAASDSDGGTPGAINSVADSDIAPLILDVEHSAIIPGPDDPVVVTARIIDELPGRFTVTVHYRADASRYRNGDEDEYPHHDPNEYADVRMLDDGIHDDGDAGDGVFGARIPSHPDGVVVEFYVEARDIFGNTRTWPAPSLIDGVPEQVTNALYQVDASFDRDAWTPGAQPIYNLIMTANEKGRLIDIGDGSGGEHNSDAEMNVTFVSVDGTDVKVRHNVGVRNRGHGSRNDPPNNYRVNFVHDRSWEGVTAINLNTKFTYLQVAGNAMFRLSGVDSPEATAVQVRLNGENMAAPGATGNPDVEEEMFGSYVHMEVVDNDFAESHFPDDEDGNAYKCMRISHQADLRYEGPEPGPYRSNYLKRTNTAADDWSGLIDMIYALSDNTPDANYINEVHRVIDVQQWLRLLAINTLLDNSETTLANGNGDDYYLYRGVEDPRFVLIQHDLDSVFGLGDTLGRVTHGIFRFITDSGGVPALERLVTHPEFIGSYYGHLKDLIETTLSAEYLDSSLDELLGDYVPPGTLGQMKDFISLRNAYVLSLIPSTFSIQTDLELSYGYYVTDVNFAIIYGTADAVSTRSVLVNGWPATWKGVEGQWDVREPVEPEIETIVAVGSPWKYFDEYTDLGAEWYIDLDDSSWPAGDAELGYGDGAEGRPEATTIDFIDTDPERAGIQRNITTYFSHSFEVDDASKYSGLIVRIMRDDGAVVYLNGVEAGRSNMRSGAVDYNTTASGNVVGSDEFRFYDISADASLLKNGTNVLAVEIHQRRASSPDISFDLELIGELKNTRPEIGVSLNPGINRIIVQTFDGPAGSGSELERGYIDVWYYDGGISEFSGTLTEDATLDAASGPWLVMADIIVPNGLTLTIEPGTTLFLNVGAGITVNQGGRLVAQGSEYERIRMTSVPGGPHWDGIKFDATLEDNRLAYVDMEFGDAQGESTDVQDARVTIDNVTWSGTNTRVLNIDHPSVICRNSVFPSISGTEPLHGVGLEGDEYLIFDGCVFGIASGYNDIIDFTGAQRPGPVLQMYNSIFLGGGDDGIDLDGTDAHIEGNVIMNFHGGGGGGTANAVATGKSGGDASEIYVARNIFLNNDHAVLLKEDCFMHAQNNIFLGCDIAVVSFGEPFRNPPRPAGKGTFMQGNIFRNNAGIFEHFFQDPIPGYGPDEVAVHNSLLPGEWHYLGLGNLDADPLFFEVPNDLRLKSGSGAIGTGAWGLDMGALAPAGAAISGEPYAVTYRTRATITVGGPGITHYKYSVNAPTGPWSAEHAVDEPIELTGLQDGRSYTVYAIGKNSAGVWQSEADAAASHMWTVDVSHTELLINEVLAHTHGANPDIIELYYDGPTSINLTGMSLTDDPANPKKFIFSSGRVITTIMNPGDYMVLYGDLTVVKNHLGFALRADGEGLYLYDTVGELIDSVEFGPQINDFSIGRVGYDRAWKLNRPSFMAANVVQPLGDPDTLKINEWLASGRVLFDDDFIELYNPHPQPVEISGMFLTDRPVAQSDKHKIHPLSFIGPQGYSVFRVNDGNDPWELDFKLSAGGEMIGLFDAGLNLIDQVLFGPQTTDVSQGRVPDGSANYEFFTLPTPGVANAFGTYEIIVSTLVPEDANKRVIVPVSPDDVDDMWYADPDFDDSSWMPCRGGPGGVGYDTGSSYDSLITLDVEPQMYEINATCYIRILFSVDAGAMADYSEMTLKVRYDDGYIAYLNGVIVDRRNFAGTPAWNSEADDDHEASGVNFDAVVDISGHIGDLRAGRNVLAIHGLNRSDGSSDFLISAELDVTSTTFNEEFPFNDDLEVLAGLRITELMYHSSSGNNFDYIEVANISGAILHLAGVTFTEGIEFTFPNMQLNPGQHVVVVRNLAAFRSAYGMSPDVAGVYEGDLSNRGEDIVLQLAWPLEAAIMRFDYSDRWYPATDGGGQSLTILDPGAPPATWDAAESWHAASPSPGAP